MKSPFKLLDPYGPEDIKAFFGRQRETKELYNLVSKNRLTFVYGPSGSGKTSLVRCGLANRFKGIDWLPLFIRRGDDINASLREALGEALGQEGAYTGELGDAIESLFHRYLRPVYLIFDQFEELFILGDPDDSLEREPFYNTIADLLELELPCRVLFIMREDYFGYLDKFERLIPELYHRKLRVEPMTRERLRDVVVGSCEVYGIPFGDAQKDPEHILDNLFAERTTIEMHFVQVYLYKLYDLAVKRQEGRGNRVRFDQVTIEKLGPIQNALTQFLVEQETKILKNLRPLDPPEDIVRRILNVFVSRDGTKIPRSYYIDEEGHIQLEGKAAEPLSLLDAALVSECIQELEHNRILSRREDKLEVAHDTLADLIDQQRSSEQRHLNYLRLRIELGYKEHLESKGTYFFDHSQLVRIEPYRKELALKKEWVRFLEDSRRNQEVLDNAEKLRAVRGVELIEENLVIKLALEKAKKNIRRGLKLLEKAKVNNSITQSRYKVVTNELENALYDVFYYYQDIYGLSYLDGKYGFIDKESNKKIDFEYDEAEPFDDPGFARVKKSISGGIQNFLIDTKGVEYPVTYYANQLNKKTVALDLRDSDLNKFSLYEYLFRNIKILAVRQM